MNLSLNLIIYAALCGHAAAGELYKRQLLFLRRTQTINLIIYIYVYISQQETHQKESQEINDFNI